MAIGPVQLLVLGFAEPKFHGEILAELDRLKENDIVRVIDGLAVTRTQKANDSAQADRPQRRGGSRVRRDRGSPDPLVVGGEEGAEAGAELGAEKTEDGVDLFPEADALDVIEEIPNDSAAAIILLEHRWAIPLRDSVARANGMPIADTFIHPLDLVGRPDRGGRGRSAQDQSRKTRKNRLKHERRNRCLDQDAGCRAAPRGVPHDACLDARWPCTTSRAKTSTTTRGNRLHRPRHRRSPT